MEYLSVHAPEVVQYTILACTAQPGGVQEQEQVFTFPPVGQWIIVQVRMLHRSFRLFSGCSKHTVIR